MKKPNENNTIIDSPDPILDSGSWGSYDKGWAQGIVATGKAIRLWILNKFRNISLTVPSEDFTVPTGSNLVQHIKEITFVDAAGHPSKFKTIVLETEAIPKVTLKFFIDGTEKVDLRMNVDSGSTITLPTPNTPSGKNFNGWYTNINYSGSPHSPNTTYTPTSTIIFYGKYEDVPNDILTMYSFDQLQNGDYSSGVQTTLRRGEFVLISNNKSYHYIPSLVSITVVKQVFGEVNPIKIGNYDSSDVVYKINANLINEQIKYI